MHADGDTSATDLHCPFVRSGKDIDERPLPCRGLLLSQRPLDFKVVHLAELRRKATVRTMHLHTCRILHNSIRWACQSVGPIPLIQAYLLSSLCRKHTFGLVTHQESNQHPITDGTKINAIDTVCWRLVLAKHCFMPLEVHANWL